MSQEDQRSRRYHGEEAGGDGDRREGGGAEDGEAVAAEWLVPGRDAQSYNDPVSG